MKDLPLIYKFWFWLGIKLGWKYLDVKKNKKKDFVEAVTFSMSKKYINKVSNLE